MGFSETIFLFLLALVIFGPKKLPEIARQVGKALNEFRRASNEFKAQIESEISQLEIEQQQILPPSQPAGAVPASPLTLESGASPNPGPASTFDPASELPVSQPSASEPPAQERHAMVKAPDA